MALVGGLHPPQWPAPVRLGGHCAQVRAVLVRRPSRPVGVGGPHELHRPFVDVADEQVVPGGRVLGVQVLHGRHRQLPPGQEPYAQDRPVWRYRSTGTGATPGRIRLR